MEYKGQIAGFPDEVVEWMLQQQVKQGNERDVTVFENCNSSDRHDKGFNWFDTSENHDFCEKVILNKRFDLFFKRYPKKQHEVKYFKYELNNESRKALELINKKNTKTVHFGKSQYYYGTDGICKKTAFGLMKDQIVSPKQIIEMFSEKKEPVKDDEIIGLIMEINYKRGLKSILRYNNNELNNILKNRAVESVIIKQDDPLFRDFEKIINGTTNSRYKFNRAKELFNK